MVYLLADVETQFVRTSRDNNRPMINVSDRRQRLEEIFKVRDPLYNEVKDFCVDSGKHSIHDCVEQIKAKLKEFEWKV